MKDRKKEELEVRKTRRMKLDGGGVSGGQRERGMEGRERKVRPSTSISAVSETYFEIKEFWCP